MHKVAQELLHQFVSRLRYVHEYLWLLGGIILSVCLRVRMVWGFIAVLAIILLMKFLGYPHKRCYDGKKFLPYRIYANTTAEKKIISKFTFVGLDS